MRNEKCIHFFFVSMNKRLTHISIHLFLSTDVYHPHYFVFCKQMSVSRHNFFICGGIKALEGSRERGKPEQMFDPNINRYLIRLESAWFDDVESGKRCILHIS